MNNVLAVGKYQGSQLVHQTRRYPGFIAGHVWSIKTWYKPFKIGDESTVWIKQRNIVNRIK